MVNSPAPDRPEPAPAGFVLEVFEHVGAAEEHRLARYLDHTAAITWPEAIDRSGDKRLHPLDLAARHGGEFRYLDAPSGSHLHGGVFATELSKIVGEPRLEQHLDCFRLACTLPRFEDRHVIMLTSRLHDAGDRGDEHAGADFVVIGRILSAEIRCGEPTNALGAVPCQPREVVAHVTRPWPP